MKEYILFSPTAMSLRRFFLYLFLTYLSGDMMHLIMKLYSTGSASGADY